MADTAFDLFVIGAGSAGVRAARMSAGFGARVAIAEAYRPGGSFPDPDETPWTHGGPPAAEVH